jgi:hypothetical protein
MLYSANLLILLNFASYIKCVYIYSYVSRVEERLGNSPYFSSIRLRVRLASSFASQASVLVDLGGKE